MTQAIELYFDSELEQAVREMWRRLADAGLPNLASFTHGRHRPHASLTVAEQIPLPALRPSIANIVPRAVPIALEHVAVFPGGVLFLGVVPTASLLETHARLDRLLRDAGATPWPHYGRWVPHVTLAMGLTHEQVSAAVALCHRDIRHLEGKVHELGAVDVDSGTCDLIVAGPEQRGGEDA